jgi:DNA-binding GntR family transcriptional regulator
MRDPRDQPTAATGLDAPAPREQPPRPAVETLPRTRAQAVAASLRHAIQSGEIPPGTPLQQADVAQWFGVSTTPVREALSTLDREGLITHVTHRGAVVFRPTVEDVRENFELRGALEPLAVRLAAPRVTEEQLGRLDALVDEMRHAGDALAFAELSRRFHAEIVRAAGRPRLVGLVDDLRQAAGAYLNLLVAGQPDLSTVLGQHERIAAALRARDGEEAAAAMADHLAYHADLIAAELERPTDAAPSPIEETYRQPRAARPERRK